MYYLWRTTVVAFLSDVIIGMYHIRSGWLREGAHVEYDILSWECDSYCTICLLLKYRGPCAVKTPVNFQVCTDFSTRLCADAQKTRSHPDLLCQVLDNRSGWLLQ